MKKFRATVYVFYALFHTIYDYFQKNYTKPGTNSEVKNTSYTNKINKCIFYTGTTNQFIRKYSDKYTLCIITHSAYFKSLNTLSMTDGYLKNYI